MTERSAPSEDTRPGAEGAPVPGPTLENGWMPLSPDVLQSRRSQLSRRRAHARQRLIAAIAGIVVVALALVLLIPGGAAHHRSAPRAAAGSRGHQLATASSHHHALSLAARQNQAINALLKRQPFISAGGTEKRDIALTFDDGPGPYTPHILRVLHRLQTPATFFTIGFMTQWFHASLVQEHQMGDAIGDHTESHPFMADLPRSAQRQQILAQTQWLAQFEIPFPRLWRPPYGSYNATTLQILAHQHMLMVLWSVDTDDWERPGVNAIVKSALAGAKPGAIILLHDAGGDRSETIAALPLIIRALRRRHYDLVTVPELILADPPHGQQVLPDHLSGG